MNRQFPYILIVDDDPEDQEMLVEQVLVQDPDMQMECVADGTQALSYLEDCNAGELPVIMVIDYQMPDMTGEKLLKLLHSEARYENIVKIVWSTSTNESYVNPCMNVGAKAYFRKPNDIAELDRFVSYLTELFNNRCKSMEDMIR